MLRETIRTDKIAGKVVKFKKMKKTVTIEKFAKNY